MICIGCTTPEKGNRPVSAPNRPSPQPRHSNGRIGTWQQNIAKELRGYQIIFLFFAAYMLVANGIVWIVDPKNLGFPFEAGNALIVIGVRAPKYLAFIAALTMLWFIVRDWLLARPSKYSSAFQAARAPFLPLIREPSAVLARTILFVALYIILMNTFGLIKGNIPKLASYDWDIALWTLDRTLHGGIDPWRLTWAVFGSDRATMIIDRIYISWYMVVHIVPFAVMLFDPNRPRRNRFVLSYFALWVLLGNVMAIGLASVGPCFTQDFAQLQQSFAPVYGPLMDKLHAVNETQPLMALELQTLLWTNYLDKTTVNLGISAMPSLHVAQAILIACLAFSYSRLLGFIAILYALLIQLGSVHLGWHYAIDGYVAALGTVVVWYVAGKVFAPTADTQTDQPDGALEPVEEQA